MTTFTKVQVFHDEESDTLSMFRPLIKFGIWNGLIGLNVDSQSHSTAVKVLHWIYMVVVQLLLLLTVLRYCFVLFVGSENGRFLDVLSAQAFFLSLSFTSLMTSYTLTKCFKRFCKLLDKHIQKYGKLQKGDRIHKFNIYVGPIGIPIVISICVTFFCLCFFLRDSLTLYLQPFDIEIQWQNALVMTHLILDINFHIFHSAIIFLLFMVIWFLFVTEFDHIDCQLKDILLEREVLKSESRIEKLRQEFISLVDCFGLFNSLFKHCIFGTLSVFLPCVCFWLYGVIRTEQETEEFAILTLLMLLNFSGVFIIVFLGAVLNSKAHQPISILNKVDILLVTEKTSRSVAMFLSRLLGPPIGFTNYGLFTIDPPAILYIFGTLVTYAVVMLQFADTAPSTIANNNCPINSSILNRTMIP
ncbi:hypothetical protein LOTGIDRAFT_159388 [Lottia gigantea]|uniref:Gustatory receptor n=1 Tax=Lottia gigantea TaxID=225164 RepID=V4A0P4_LOTGI|nr:hypothetical protein LOTGIDRAFT_159388 [Lottia gigantea]ESO97358.1 hypothetical protein LOTGIDRAFT_159388 [Lottia gigantea]